MGKEAIKLSDDMARMGFSLDVEGRLVQDDEPSAPFERLADEWFDDASERETFWERPVERPVNENERSLWERHGQPRPYLLTVESPEGLLYFVDNWNYAEQELGRFAERVAQGAAVPEYASERFDALYVEAARSRLQSGHRAFPVTFTCHLSATLYVEADNADSAWDKAREALESPDGRARVWEALNQADASDIEFDIEEFDTCPVTGVVDELLDLLADRGGHVEDRATERQVPA